MPVLGGSPLGLINVNSNSRNGITTFNDGKSRNVNVKNYNEGKDKYPVKDLIPTTDGTFTTPDINEGTRSIFSGPAVIAPYGTIAGSNKSKDVLPYTGLNRSTLHNDQIYDTSLLNIIEQLSKTEASLRFADFAYLKDVGVFPNNRLMIARRFSGPHLDNIFNVGTNELSSPLVALISWKPQGEDFLQISFGEEWVPAEADFKNVLNSLGNDFLGKQFGDKVGGAVAAVPLPGFTETIQRVVLQKLGVLEDNPNVPLPSGNPNLIKEARRRKTIGYSEAGSGLKCSVSIKFVCEWEQKFISGLDPTIVFQDILARVANFATSRSSTYGMSAKAYKQFESFLGKGGTRKMLDTMITAIKEALGKVIEEVTAAITALQNTTTKEASTQAAETDLLTKARDKLQTAATDASNLLDRQIQKYKIELLGIARALTGLPSTPWHVTLGNPLRPVFCAGDMYMSDDLTLTLGSTLAFNDLPSTIKAEFTLVNARPWGLQEILAKFNSGSIRVSTTLKDENDKNTGDKENALAGITQKEKTNETGASASTATTPSVVTGTGAKVATTTNVSGTSSVVSVGPVNAGTQPLPTPTLANNYNQNLPTVDNTTLTAGIGSNIASAQNSVSSVQSSVNNNLSNAQNSASGVVSSVSNVTAATTTKYTGDIVQVGSAINPVATEVDAVTSLSNINIGSFA
jgi:hypothetical protein